MKYKLAIFDMDGTILDTLEDLKNSANYALRTNGLPERTLDEIRAFVGNGISALIKRAVPTGTDEALQEQVFQTFTAYYAKHCADATKPYEGIVPLLHALRASGIHTAVVSNKADFAVQELVNTYFDRCFDAAIGEHSGIRKKPAPDMVYEVISALQMKPSDAIYIGDSDVDLATAKNAGLPCISVEWGFRTRDFLMEHGAELLIRKPEEILSLLR